MSATLHFCATCGATVPEAHLTTGIAVAAADNQVHCYRCVTTRAVPLSDSTVFRALSAKMAQGPLKRTVKRMSERLLTQMPDGRIKGFVKRVSQRLFVPRTAQYRSIKGSSPRNRPPAAAIAAVAANTRRQTEARNLAWACAACVVLALGALTIYLAASKVQRLEARAQKDAAAAQAPAPVRPASPGLPAEAPASQQPVAPNLAAATPPDAKTDTKKEPLAIPPLLGERDSGAVVSSKDFKAQLAQDRLNEANDFLRDHPAETATYQRKLTDIANAYRGTPAALAAAKLLAEAPKTVPQNVVPQNVVPLVAPPPVLISDTKPAATLDWFAAWQVENLDKRAKVRMFDDFGGRKSVLETYPPDPLESLRMKQAAKLPAGKPFLELSVRGPENGEFELLVETGGKKATAGVVRGTEWQTFAFDLASAKAADAAVTLHHATVGGQSCSAYWQAPAFVAQPGAGAKVINWSAEEPAAVAANSGDPWSRAVNLLAMAQPHRDAVSGIWTLEAGALVSDKSQYARLEIPYRPPQEYDLRLRFTRQEGADCVVQILSVGDRSFGWVMGGVNNTVFGFETVAGVSTMANPTAVKQAKCLENGKSYTALVQVRRTGLKAFLDGQLLCQWRTDFADMDIYRDWKLRLPGVLGIGSLSSRTAFQSLELLEVTGKGKALAAETVAAAAPRATDPKLEYEASLFDIYGLLATKGAAPALERLEQTKTNPLLVPLRAKLERDAECIVLVKDARETALAGAAKLADNRAFTFVKTDGKEVAAGAAATSTVKSVAGTAILLEEAAAAGKASVKLDYNDLSPRTQYELLRLGSPVPAVADLKIAILKLARCAQAVAQSAKSPLADEVRMHVEAARKDAALADKCDHVLAQLAFFQRDLEARQRFEAFEVLCRQQKWRDAKLAAEEFKNEYLNSYALERVTPALERWTAVIEKETASPLLKR